MKCATAAAAFAFAYASAAQAEMPDYDVASYCQRVSDAVGKSEEIRHACLVQEQMAYDTLKPQWDALATSMRNHCDQVARSVGQSFEILKACVDQERQATKENQQFQFKR